MDMQILDAGTEHTKGNPLTDSPIAIEEVESAISQLKHTKNLDGVT